MDVVSCMVLTCLSVLDLEEVTVRGGSPAAANPPIYLYLQSSMISSCRFNIGHSQDPETQLKMINNILARED